jgi:nitrite reductase (NADH) small subunit
MAEFVRAARVSDIPPGAAAVVGVGAVQVALFNVNGSFHAVDNQCCHRQGPLGEGELDGTTVVCPWHGWSFDVTSGQCLSRPGARVASYEVRVEGDDIFVKA